MINVQIVDENLREVLLNSKYNFDIILNYIFDNDLEKKYIWLGTIDPYGYAVINILQKNNFIEELEDLREKGYVDNELNNTIVGVVNMLRNMTNHQYMLLTGD